MVKYGFADAVRALHLAPSVQAGRRLLAAVGRHGSPSLSRPQRIRLALEELGPTFIKFGQALSTRADVLPAEVVAELTLLQDAVTPLAPDVPAQVLREEFGEPVDELFEAFDPAPVAAASIAQVHTATLRSGEMVAIKIRRPGIEHVIEADLAVLADLAELAERHWPDAHLYSLSALVDEFARTIRREIDLAREGHLIERIAAQFDGDDTVRFPKVYWPFTSRRVLTMEYLDGVKVSSVSADATPDLDAVVIAERGASAVLRQVLQHGLFHADPHPGNILVLPGNVVAFIDFGIIGRTSRRMRQQLARVVMAVNARDAERLADLVLQLAIPLAPVDHPALIDDLEEMLDLYAEVPIGQLSMRDVFGSITAAMSRHRLRLPADLLLLIKSISTIESVGRKLDPSFKIVARATPFVEELIAASHRPRAVARRSIGYGRDTLKALARVPADVAALTGRMRRDGLRIEFVHRNLDYFIREMDRSSNRLSFAVIIAAVVIGSAIMVHSGAGPAVFGYPLPGIVGFLAAGLLGIGLAIAILRSGRL